MLKLEEVEKGESAPYWLKSKGYDWFFDDGDVFHLGVAYWCYAPVFGGE